MSEPRYTADEIQLIEVTCYVCRETKMLAVPKEAYRRWKNKELLIQDAFPRLSTGDRELLISQTCGPCFDSLFAADETD